MPFLLTLLIAPLFYACSYYSELKPTITSEPAIQVSRSGDIVNDGYPKALISATYLNALLPEKHTKEESFIIGVFIDDELPENDRKGLDNPNYTLTLNGKEATSIAKLGENDPLLEHLPVQNRWKHDYLISFPSQKSETLILTLTHKVYGATDLLFKTVR